MNDKQKTEQLDHWKTGVGKPSPYAGSWDLPGEFGNIELTIKVAKKEITHGLKDNKMSVVLYFNEEFKPMIMNATNSKMLRAITGSPFIQNWAGVRIELRVEKDVKAFGSVHDTLRITSKRIKTTKVTITKDHPKFAEIKAKYDAGSSIDVIRKYYDIDEKILKS